MTKGKRQQKKADDTVTSKKSKKGVQLDLYDPDNNESDVEGRVVAPWRHYFLLSVVALAAVAVLSRSAYLQLWDREFLRDQGDRRVLRTETIPAHRGMIMDRHGEPLAVSTPMLTVWANPKQLINAESYWPVLAKGLGQPLSRVQERINANKNRSFMYLRRHMSPERAQSVLDLDIPGVHAMTEYRRYYPAGEVAAHVVGFTNIDGTGQEGLELAYDQQLQGMSGKKRVVKDLRGRVVKDVGLVRDATPGQNLYLSLDLKAQYLAYRELLSTVKQFNAESGSAVVLDVETGEVLAMVNQPSYNPNNRRNMNINALRNRAVTDVFEPGSTVKPFTVAAAMESGEFEATTLVDTAPGFMRVGSKAIRDHRNYGTIDLSTIITKSSNVGVTKLALALPDPTLGDLFSQLGLGQSTGIGFPGESTGVLPSRIKWRPIEVATLSYGYGLSVTTLQLAQAYSVIANNGIKKPVSLLKVPDEYEAKLNAFETFDEPRVLGEQASKDLVNMLKTVVSREGTALRAQVPGYTVAGKTGTVHKVTSQGYADDRYIALFAGFAPADKPSMVLVVMVDDPKGDDYYGGVVAAPAFSRIMSGVLRSQGVPPQRAVDRLAQGTAEAKSGGPRT